MKRSEAREQAFCLVFEKFFTDEPIPEIIEMARDVRDQVTDDFAKKIAEGVITNLEIIDQTIEKHSTSWKMNRISRVSLAILRVAVFEILFMEDIPDSVSINEAVELCKKFAGEDDSAFVNGVLGAVVRAMETNS
jgi:N utilization substance protein B